MLSKPKMTMTWSRAKEKKGGMIIIITTLKYEGWKVDAPMYFVPYHILFVCIPFFLNAPTLLQFEQVRVAKQQLKQFNVSLSFTPIYTFSTNSIVSFEENERLKLAHSSVLLLLFSFIRPHTKRHTHTKCYKRK